MEVNKTPQLGRENLDWMDDGACSDPLVDPELFFPSQGGQSAAAIKLCGACIVRQVCREYAPERPYLSGVWGATTERQRKVLRKGSAGK
jgi:WhiB family redox-sensing transcriptional regulator